MANITTFTLTSPATQSDAPFAFGQAFKKGEVLADRFVNAKVGGVDLTDWQAIPTAYYKNSDGSNHSIRHVIFAGRTDTANNTVTLQLEDVASDRAGTDLTEANLATALVAAPISLVCGAETINLADLVGTGAMHRPVSVGPIMGNWLYRKPLIGSNHLVAWFDVRLYLGGTVEIFPWIENGYLLVASPTNDIRTYTLTIGGEQKFSQAIDIKHHTRIPLITGSDHSYWTADPQITPGHNVTHLMATKMVPNYGYTPNESALSDAIEYATTYTPNWLGRTPAAMGSEGFGKHIGLLPNWAAGFCASGDARAYKATIVNGMAGGSWHIHYRDETTNEPLKFSDFPLADNNGWGGTPAIPSGAGGVNSSAAPDRAHQPSLAYLPWLLTGRWFFLDEHLFWVTWNYLQMPRTSRGQADGIFFDNQTRARGWSLRSLAQAFAVIPDSHPLYTDIKASWEANARAYEGRYVTGTSDSGTWVNNLGCTGLYSSFSGSSSLYQNTTSQGYWWEAPWQQATMCLAFASAWDMDLAQTLEAKASHFAVRNHTYKLPVGLAGDGSAGTHWYRRFGVYAMPYGTDNLGIPPDTWLSDFGTVYAAKELYGNNGSAMTAIPDPEGTSVYDNNELATANDWSRTSQVAFLRAALAYAVSHAAGGASDGYERITSASNYSTSDFTTNSVWAIAPRAIEEGTEGESFRFDEELIADAFHFGNRGLGVLASAVPSTGTHGASYLYNDLSLPADANYEVRGAIETWPTLGTLTPYEDGSFTYAGPDGTHTFTYRLYVGGVDKGTATETIEVGSVGPTTRNVAGTNSTQVNSSTSGAINIVRNVAGTGSVQVNVSTSGAITINYTPQTRNVAGTHTTQINYSTILPAATPGEEKITFSLGRKITRKLTDELSGLDD